MNLIMLGPPGAGKGTVAVSLREKLDIPHVSTGDLFRFHMKNETELGKKVKEIIASGALVPDEITTQMVKERCKDSDVKNGIILDGYPRTLGQAEALDTFMVIDKVLNYELDENEVVRRLSGRRLCPNCSAGYHIEFMKPLKEGICDKCNYELIIRDDDQKDAILNRLKVYKAQTEPLISYYSKKGIMVSIDASQTPDTVFLNSMEIIKA